jgi:hypothetical protein
MLTRRKPPEGLPQASINRGLGYSEEDKELALDRDLV